MSEREKELERRIAELESECGSLRERTHLLEGILDYSYKSLASSTEPREVLDQIILGAKLVLNADSATIWSYDPSDDKFLLERSAVSGIPD
ncbi:MAG TPA: hypothetical protein VF762_06185, partial [Blastocatellia bacterium]